MKTSLKATHFNQLPTCDKLGAWMSLERQREVEERGKVGVARRKRILKSMTKAQIGISTSLTLTP